jgi:hypothetical protein
LQHWPDGLASTPQGDEMSPSKSASVSTADASYEPTSAPAPSAEVLITEQEVLFGTSVAVPVPRESVVRRVVASITRIFAVSTPASRPQRRDYPKHYEFLERSLMGREMDRL